MQDIHGPYIERCPHDRKNPYALVNRYLIRDERLHPSTRWMLIYLLSMEDGWKISPSQIKNHCKGHYACGRDKVYDWIKEAIECGYMHKEEWLERGLSRSRYLLSEFPKFKKFLPDPDCQDSDRRDPVSTYYKKEHIPSELKKEHIKKESSLTLAKESAENASPVARVPRAPPASVSSDDHKNSEKDCLEETTQKAEESAENVSPVARVPRAPHVATSFEDHKKLVKDFGEEMTQKAYEKLSEWKQDTPKSKWKKNDNLAIRRWVVDAIKEKNLRQQRLENALKTPQESIKEVQVYIQSNPKKEVLKRAANENLISIDQQRIVVYGVHGPDGILEYKNQGCRERIDQLIRRLEQRFRC